jgi:hypothetical protein
MTNRTIETMARLRMLVVDDEASVRKLGHQRAEHYSWVGNRRQRRPEQDVGQLPGRAGRFTESNSRATRQALRA